MTLADLLNDLNDHPSNAALIFETDAGPIGPGYHVTELKRADITSIDCGANVAEWSEVALQLLDGAKGTHMSVGRLAAILSKSLGAVERLGESPLHVEFAHENVGLRLYDLAKPVRSDDAVRVHLTERSAVCKPAVSVPVEKSKCYSVKPPEGCC